MIWSAVGAMTFTHRLDLISLEFMHKTRFLSTTFTEMESWSTSSGEWAMYVMHACKQESEWCLSILILKILKGSLASRSLPRDFPIGKIVTRWEESPSDRGRERELPFNEPGSNFNPKIHFVLDRGMRQTSFMRGKIYYPGKRRR